MKTNIQQFQTKKGHIPMEIIIGQQFSDIRNTSKQNTLQQRFNLEASVFSPSEHVEQEPMRCLIPPASQSFCPTETRAEQLPEAPTPEPDNI